VRATALLALLVALLASGWLAATAQGTHGVGLPLILAGGGPPSGVTPDPTADPDPTTVPDPTVIPDPTATPDPTPGGPGDVPEWLIGSWEYTNLSGSFGLLVIYEFYGDGTFEKTAVAVMNPGYGVNLFEGRYRVSGDDLTLYDQMRYSEIVYSWDDVYALMANPPVRDTPRDDETFAFDLTAEGNLMLGDTEYVPMVP